MHVPSDAIAAADPEWGAGLLGDKAHSMVFDNAKLRSVVPGFARDRPVRPGRPGDRRLARRRPLPPPGGRAVRRRGGHARRAVRRALTQDGPVLLVDARDDVVPPSPTTRSRLAKRALLVDLLRRTPPEDVAGSSSRYLGGQLRQRRTGLGWRSLTLAARARGRPVADRAGVDAVFEEMSQLAGPGLRHRAAARSPPDAVRGGHRRRAAAAARAGHRRAAAGRRSTRCCSTPSRRPRGSRRRPCGARRCSRATPSRSRSPRSRRPDAGRCARRVHARRSGGPCARCWRSRPPTSTAPWASLGPGPVVVDSKLDGIRIQVHRARRRRAGVHAGASTTSPPACRRSSRSCARCRRRTWCSTARRSPSAPDGRPRPFQETVGARPPRERRRGRRRGHADARSSSTCLHVDGVDLLDAPLLRRLDALDAVARVRRWCTGWSPTTSPRRAAYFADVVRAGQEGVVIKAADAPVRGRAARRARGSRSSRGTPWTSWCSRSSGAPGGGRGLLSNIHLGARDRRAGSSCSARRSRA